MRIGHGYDVHRLVKDRALIIGGVKIDYEYGLLGHSDADVALHALMDAILGALGLGDIGSHFSDQDEEFKDIDSKVLLERVVDMMKKTGYQVGNVDVTIIAQRPKMAPHIHEMKKILASYLEVDITQVNVKATTEEHLGFTGQLEGIKSHAVCLLIPR
ncbi:2-C-methyl-D-erythritol 2,4-cyclodiphosphate synthase [Vallitaleaceae bacterium 9-2]